MPDKSHRPSGGGVQGGGTGRIAFVNLTNGRIDIEPVDMGLAEKYIGAEGINIRLLYDHVPRRTDPLGPDNMVIIAAGTLTGTIAPGASRLLISTKSPLMGQYGNTNGGMFVDRMRASGFAYL